MNDLDKALEKPGTNALKSVHRNGHDVVLVSVQDRKHRHIRSPDDKTSYEVYLDGNLIRRTLNDNDVSRQKIIAYADGLIRGLEVK